MKIIQTTVILACLLCFNIALCQKRVVYYINTEGAIVDSLSKAEYIRMVSEPDSNSNLLNVNDYYKNKKLKMVGKATFMNSLVLEGRCISYYPSGSRKQVANYIHGSLDGEIYDYYPNGILHTIKKHDATMSSYLVQRFNDTTGKAMVTDGNGYYINYSEDFGVGKDEGEIKDGLKNGYWKGIRGKDHYTENYNEGQFISGETIDIKGKVYPYTKINEEPHFRGGEEAFMRFINSNLRYPSNYGTPAAAGKVYISFIIDTDGLLTDIKPSRSTNSDDLVTEAIRVIKLSPRWIPGKQYGVPVKVQFTIPVAFF